MKIKENIYILELPNINPQSKDFVYPTVIKDGSNLTLIDTGYPKQIEHIKSELEKDGLDINNIKTIILTHQDIDHVGNVKDILNLVPGVEIISYNEEAEYINGNKTPCKVESMERNLDKMDEKGKKFYHFNIVLKHSLFISIKILDRHENILLLQDLNL